MSSRARMRAIRVGVRNSVNAIWHATMLIASLFVSAMMMSASRPPARSSTSGYDALPDDRAHVEPVLQLAQHVGVLVDDRDFVGLFAREAERSRAADLSSPENQDLHPRRSLPESNHISSRLA